MKYKNQLKPEIYRPSVSKLDDVCNITKQFIKYAILHKLF